MSPLRTFQGFFEEISDVPDLLPESQPEGRYSRRDQVQLVNVKSP
jgi:hypothetical protein